MDKYILENIERYGNLIFSKINNMLLNNNNKLIKLDFSIIENNLFLYVEIDNGIVKEKIKINIDIEDIKELYKKLFELFKENYLEDSINKVSVIKQINLINYDNPYLNLHIKNNIHSVEINLYLRNLINEKEILNQIEEEWLNIIKEKKSNRTR